MERLEAEFREEARRAEAERAETGRIEAERAEAERIEAERVEAELDRREAERLQALRLERRRLEAERQRAEAERIERERLEAERIERERRAAEEESRRARRDALRAEALRCIEEISLEGPAAELPPARLRAPRPVTLPRAQEISSGHVWPPVKGRAAIAAAASGELSRPDVPVEWAASPALELQSSTGWVVHSCDRWVFTDETEARQRLHHVVRRLLSRVQFCPESRALALGREAEGWRLWVFTPAHRTVRESVVDCLDGRMMGALERLLRITADGLLALAASGGASDGIVGGASGLAVHDGTLRILAVDEGDGDPGPRGDPLVELGSLIRQRAQDDAELSDWLAATGGRFVPEAAGPAEWRP
jgi:hypothetical protein